MDHRHKVPKKKPSKIEDMTKEQIKQAIQKKRECNAKAQQIVESLLESCISEEYFLKCLPDINQCHLEDVIEERSIIHLCGYPICSRHVSEKDIPKQKYRISMKTNKVYDITARKSFCSNSCYKSAMYIKRQLLTSPLWFREYEEMPKFDLMPLDISGSLGQEVDLSLIEKIESENKPFTALHDFTSASLDEISKEELTNNKSTNNKTNKEGAKNIELQLENNMTIVKTNICEQKLPKPNNNRTLNENSNSSINVKSDSTLKKPPSTPPNIIGEILEKPASNIDPVITQVTDKIDPKPINNSVTSKTILHKRQPAVTVITIEVEKCFAEWFTLDTMLLLFGEEKVKDMVADKGECIKNYLNNYSKGIFYSSNSYDQYQALCRKLNILELEDRRNDAETLQKETRPLPNYSMLQEESKKMQLKVKAFFAGETNIPSVESLQESEPNEENNLTNLPLVDKNAQNALRRRIVCEHLNKVLPDLLRSLGLLALSISSDVRLLVNTFKLRADNIMFKPIQWTLIAIVVIKLLSLRDRRLEYLLKQSTAFQHMQLLLLSYEQDGGYLDRLVSWLTDIDRLLDTNDTQLTLGK